MRNTSSAPSIHGTPLMEKLGWTVKFGSLVTIDGTLFDKDDQVYVVVTPNDGIEDGAPVTSPTLTILR